MNAHTAQRINTPDELVLSDHVELRLVEAALGDRAAVEAADHGSVLLPVMHHLKTIHTKTERTVQPVIHNLQMHGRNNETAQKEAILPGDLKMSCLCFVPQDPRAQYERKESDTATDPDGSESTHSSAEVPTNTQTAFLFLRNEGKLFNDLLTFEFESNQIEDEATEMSRCSRLCFLCKCRWINALHELEH